jgi:phosphatidylglycerophosphate synthase
MLDAHRNIFKDPERKIGKFFSYLPLKPNHYTITSLLFAFVAFYFLLKINILLAVLFFVFSSFLDFVDGAVARYKNQTTKFGAYLDTIIDRFAEGIFLLGFLFLPLPEIFLKSYIWIFLILFGSLMTTYAKAAAKEKDLVVEEMKGGLLARGERITLIIISLILGYFINFYLTVCFLIGIAFLTNFTALQRIYFAYRKK